LKKVSIGLESFSFYNFFVKVMNINFQEVQKKWQKVWKDSSIYKTTEEPNKPKYYVLDMFPYPSGT